MIRPYSRPDLLIAPSALNARRADPALRILDLRPIGPFLDDHVPDALRLDEATLRHPDDAETYLPPPDAFQSLMRGLGVGPKTWVVAYDDAGGRSATRLWFCLSVYGHRRFSLLDGGWKRWEREGLPRSRESLRVEPGTFRAAGRPGPLSCPTAQLLRRRKDLILLDARAPDEWSGVQLSPGAKQTGRIPGAVNVDWRENLDPNTGQFKDADTLRRLYREKGISPDKEIVTYCASGGRASLSLFALTLIGYKRVRLYYGSFSDYSARRDVPIES